MASQATPEQEWLYRESVIGLFSYLLTLLDMPDTAPELDQAYKETVTGPADIVALGIKYGLHIDSVVLSPSAAGKVSSPEAPLIAQLSLHSWLVLSGYTRGRIRATLVQGELQEQRRLTDKQLAQLLGAGTDIPADWLLVQAQAPLENAVSKDHHEHLPPFTRLLELVRADRRDFWLLLGLAMGAGLLALASPVAVQALVNTVAMGGMGQPLLVLTSILFFFLVFGGMVYVLEAYLVEVVQRRIFVRLATDMAYRLPKVHHDAYSKYDGAELVNRFFDVLTLQKAGSALLLDGLSTITQTAVGLIVLAFYHPFLLGFDVVLLLSIGLIIFVLGRGAVATAIKESLAKYALVAWLETVAEQMQIFKFNGGPRLARQETDRLSLDYLDAKQQHYKILQRQIIGSVALYAVASTSLLAIGGFLVINGHLTLGQLVAAELIVSSALVALIKFGKHLEGFYDLMAGTDKIGHLLDLPLERESGSHFESPTALGIQVDGLDFTYENQLKVFENLSFQISPAEKVAFLSESTGGKTTLLHLLTGMIAPQRGRILFNEQLLEDLELTSLRSHIAVVSRYEFIAGSVYENVQLGRATVDPARVQEALETVGLSDADGFDPDGLIAIDGMPLCQTHAILLMIARAIAGKPALLILDAIVDGLPESNQRLLLKNLTAAETPWTLLLMTDLPQLAALCPRIIRPLEFNNA